MRRAQIIAAAVVVALLVCSALAATRLKVVTDIRHFIPTQSDRGLSDVSAELAGSALTRTSILVVEGPRHIEAAAELAATLVGLPDVEWVRRGVDQQLQETLRGVYQARAPYLARPDLSDDGLASAGAALKRTLGGPKGPLLRTMAPSDPLLLFLAVADRLRKGDGEGLDSVDGQFVTADGSAAVLFVRTRSSAFDSEPQARLVAEIDRTMAQLRADLDPGLTLSTSGLARFAIAAERSTRADITRVSIVSTVCMVAVFLLVFGQFRALLLAFAPVVLGVGGGVAACSLLVSEVHGLTLAFGAALLGVGVDYALHLQLHLAHARGRTVGQVVARIRPGLLLGAATTVVGLGGLTLTSFPGMRELSLFGAAGIAGSLAVTLLLVPAFGTSLPPRRVRQRLIDVSRVLLDRVERSGRRTWLLFVAVVGFGAAGLVPLHWSDGLRELYQVDAQLLEQDTRVRALTGAIDMSRMVLATGTDVEHALQRNGEVYEAVERARVRGDLAGYRSVQPWLPAASWQQENLARLRDPAFAGRFGAAFEDAGFRPGAFDEFFQAIEHPASQPLTLAALHDTPLLPIVDPFVLTLHDRVVVVTWLRGELSESLRNELSALDDVQLFDQQEWLDRAYARYRVEMIQMLVVGLGGVALLIFLRYRRLGPSLAAFVPALAGGMGAIGVAGWVDGTANLIHGASLLLVCSIGADYGVFMVESSDDRQERAVTMAASLLAGLTTVLSFGLLAMSDNPALASVGRSVVAGVACALLTAPVAATLRKDPKP